ncbi:hypothetical protein HOL21_02150 [Candidatus Woesearchaeota archaeon]|jgi:hypothetical protein|nr:hypothetical protein [Candidatus Woesearchaeota archaeon]MBT5396993.1 hypothetical protein [Candidatus Woesearchaeota archaeon]MBT5924972.1 hypothetical protein [Candidatus Woesearchaeota archaeon]MBT6367461.1 hypothetical protein [Candidatus Woesearchaeota archaeon]MBT7762393.1 hypothetical protein [Candidatus Woesearchaeota archaeon]
MKKFSKEGIDGTRAYFEDNFDEIEVTLGDSEFSYFVLPHTLEPNLKNFVFRCTGEPEDGYVFGISDTVPEQFRQYAVAHEYIEFMRIGMGTPDRCMTALEEELKLVPKDIRHDYMRMRRDFFHDLIQYCEAKPEKYTPDDIAEFKGSLRLLEELVQ